MIQEDTTGLIPGTVNKKFPLGFLAVDHSDFIFQAFPGVPMDSF